FGIISSTTEPFCRTCDRSRLTADGMWYLCLYATRGVDLRGPLRRGAGADELNAIISAGWRRRDDRGAEDRLPPRRPARVRRPPRVRARSGSAPQGSASRDAHAGGLARVRPKPGATPARLKARAPSFVVFRIRGSPGPFARALRA